MEKSYDKKKYLTLLSKEYKNINEVTEEIINLQAILNLPKGTEMFLSDIHGEYAPFEHILNNGAGIIKSKIDYIFGNTISKKERATLATLIYYPEEKLKLIKKEEKELNEWYNLTLYRLIEVAKKVSSKYTRSKVRKAITNGFEYVIDELLNSQAGNEEDKERYYKAIINTIIRLNQSEKFIIAISNLIKRMAIDHLHIIGDIYDRGPKPDLLIEKLEKFHSIDIQWGNHDIIWMGAAAGNLACVATVIRNSIRYGNIDLLEEGYGINMLPLATFAMRVYADDPCERFVFKTTPTGKNFEENEMTRRMHKAIAIIRFKLEGQLIKKYPEYGMRDRLLLEHIDYENGTVEIEGKNYPMLDMHFPTIDPEDPYKLTDEEHEVMIRLRSSFLHCEKLQTHVQLLLKKGGMHKVYNGNLLFHGCIPMMEDGSFAKVNVYGKEYSGKALFDVLESYVRKAFFSTDKEEREKGADIMWYIWTAPYSPLYGRRKMATFERYFLEEEDLHVETKNCYYELINKPEIADKILAEFGLAGSNCHIINGHVPVHRMKGESPVKCNGKVIVIDGGFSKAYRSRTGIAGYTLIFNSYGLTLTAHEPFESPETAVREERDIVSKREAVEYMDKRILVGDTDVGEKIRLKIDDLKLLISAYRSGEIIEKDK